MTARRSVRFGAVIAVRMLLAAVAGAAAAPTGYAQVITSTCTGVSGNWTNPTMWSTNPNYPNNGTPAGTTYNAVVNGPAANTVALDAPITIDQLTLQSGMIGGTADLTVAGSMSFYGGRLGGSGNVTVAGNAEIRRTTGGTLPTVAGRTLTLRGPQVAMTDQTGVQPWLDIGTAGRLVVSSGTTITTSGTAPAVFHDSGNGTALVSNAGTIRTPAGAGGLFTQIHFDNSGLIDHSGGQFTIDGRFQGTGTVSGAGQVYIAGITLAPGPGVMHMQSPVRAVSAGNLELGLNGPTAGTGYDQLDLSGGGSIDLTAAPIYLITILRYVPAPTDRLTILLGGPVLGQFAGLPNGAEFQVGSIGAFNYDATITYTPSSVVLSNFRAVPLPEPAAWLLAGGAAVGWAVWRKSRRRAPDRSSRTPRLQRGAAG